MGRRTTTLRAAAAGVALLLLVACSAVMFPGAAAEKLHTRTFRSPGFVQAPGDVVDDYYVAEMPKGHVAIRKFDAEVVDVDGTPIPLHETYLHHWILVRYYVPEDAVGDRGKEQGIIARNAGVCTNGTLPQLFGLGSETRRTNTTLPPPYGIVVGDPKSIPEGHKEVWILNVHAIDTRGAVDARGCTECLCDLYNVTVDGKDSPIPAGYEGGLLCCLNGQHCDVRPDFHEGNGNGSSSKRRTLFMEYTVTWVDMSDEVIPVKVYILDVTDSRTAIDDESDGCQIEYTVDKCAEGASECIHTSESVAFFPDGGDVIYAVAHQHAGGIGCTLHSEHGEEICSSFPIYGDGSEAANEDGYIVGMTTCYPEPGSVSVRAGEKVQLRSFYNSEVRHTGVMGLFYLLVAEPQSPPRQHKCLHPGFCTNMILVAVTIIAAIFFIGLTISRLLSSRRGGTEYQLVA